MRKFTLKFLRSAPNETECFVASRYSCSAQRWGASGRTSGTQLRTKGTGPVLYNVNFEDYYQLALCSEIRGRACGQTLYHQAPRRRIQRTSFSDAFIKVLFFNGCLNCWMITRML